MKLLVDMNLSPKWCSVLQAEGWDAVHWSDVGTASATDRAVMQWALRDERVVLTHDLDFGAILAATQATGPSVVQGPHARCPANFACAALDSLVAAIHNGA
jgi:predicted nuclease of predicted toxin-antitoxin system